MVTLHQVSCASMITCRWILFRMRNVLDKSCVENANTHFMSNNLFLFSKIMSLWDNVEKLVEADRLHKKIYRCAEEMRVACRISKAKYRHTFIMLKTYCFSTATMVMRTQRNVRFLSCIICVLTPGPTLVGELGFCIRRSRAGIL